MAQFRKDTHRYLGDGTTIFETVMLADKYGNLVGAANPTGTAVDAFGRARTSLPFTLFDSFNRYGDNGKFNYANTANGSYAFVSNTASIDLTVTTTANTYVYSESKRVFAYQPGKSLQILDTFVMNPSKTNLRQRVGYFGTDNGFFLERSDNVYLVKRSKVTGTAQDTRVAQANWNVDPLDGTGPSRLTLDLDNPQILFIDIEWLGTGSVKMGFIINGEMVHCHSFHHANLSTAPKGAYIQTACLPIRYEIENTGATASNSTLKKICSTVVSEGGYELSGKQRLYGISPVSGSSFDLATAGTYYPVVSIRLHANTMDAIVLPKQIDILPINTDNYRWEIIEGATLTGGTWANVATDSPVQYNSNVSAIISGGTVLNGGYISSSVLGGNSLNVGGDIFKYQLERNTFANTTSTWTLAITPGTNGSNVAAQIVWEEVT